MQHFYVNESKNISVSSKQNNSVSSKWFFSVEYNRTWWNVLWNAIIIKMLKKNWESFWKRMAKMNLVSFFPKAYDALWNSSTQIFSVSTFITKGQNPFGEYKHILSLTSEYY